MPSVLRQSQIASQKRWIEFLAGATAESSGLIGGDGFELAPRFGEPEVHRFPARLYREDEWHVGFNSRMEGGMEGGTAIAETRSTVIPAERTHFEFSPLNVDPVALRECVVGEKLQSLD